MSPHGVVGKHYDVALTYGHIDDRRFVHQFGASRQHSTDQKTLFIRSESQDYARSHFRGRDKRALLKPLLVRQFTGSSLLSRLGQRHPLDDVRVGHSSAAGWSPAGAAPSSPLAATTAASATARTAGCGHLEQRRLIKINRQSFGIAVSN